MKVDWDQEKYTQFDCNEKPYKGILSDETFALANWINGFSLFGTRSSVLGHEFDGFNVGYVENLNSYRDEPFFSKYEQIRTINDMQTVILGDIDPLQRTYLVKVRK